MGTALYKRITKVIANGLKDTLALFKWRLPKIILIGREIDDYPKEAYHSADRSGEPAMITKLAKPSILEC